MIQFSTSKGRFAVVEVPKDASQFEIDGNVLFYYASFFGTDKIGRAKHLSRFNEYAFIFCTNTVTEEDAKEVVDDYGNGMYYDYSLPEMFGYLRTALESLTSLLKSLQIDTSLCWCVCKINNNGK